MAGRDLLQGMGEPAHATPECEQDQGRLLRQVEHLRERGEREIYVRVFADDVFDSITKIGIRLGQCEMLQQSRRAWIALRVEGMSESGYMAALRKPVPDSHVGAGTLHPRDQFQHPEGRPPVQWSAKGCEAAQHSRRQRRAGGHGNTSSEGRGVQFMVSE